MNQAGRVVLGAALLAGLGLAAVGAWRVAMSPDPDAEAGKALFSGDVPLKGRMVGHEMDLPATTVRCANCHAQPGTAPPTAPSTARTPSAAPADIYTAALSQAALLESRPRRGGPPSRYDLAAFCRVLREGIDPASVMVTQTMPRYRVTDQECHQLWTFATAR